MDYRAFEDLQAGMLAFRREITDRLTAIESSAWPILPITYTWNRGRGFNQNLVPETISLVVESARGVYAAEISHQQLQDAAWGRDRHGVARIISDAVERLQGR